MNKKNKQINLQDWKYRDKSDGGLSYYYAKISIYQVEIHSVNNRIEVAIYRNGTLKKQPFVLEIPMSEFVPRYNSIMTTITDLIESINQDL